MIIDSQFLNLESAVSKSPIFSYFNEAITGVSTIRAYGMEDRFLQGTFSSFFQSFIYIGRIHAKN